jgi:ureidoacrylate peracid hydrolase
VETSLRDAFNLGYDVGLISDATASGFQKHYETTLERVRDYYGLVMNINRFKKAITNLDKIRKGEIDLRNVPEETLSAFLDEFNLLDPRTFVLTKIGS